jgi:hypothetical protein
LGCNASNTGGHLRWRRRLAGGFSVYAAPPKTAGETPAPQKFREEILWI